MTHQLKTTVDTMLNVVPATEEVKGEINTTQPTFICGVSVSVPYKQVWPLATLATVTGTHPISQAASATSLLWAQTESAQTAPRQTFSLGE